MCMQYVLTLRGFVRMPHTRAMLPALAAVRTAARGLRSQKCSAARCWPRRCTSPPHPAPQLAPPQSASLTLHLQCKGKGHCALGTWRCSAWTYRDGQRSSTLAQATSWRRAPTSSAGRRGPLKRLATIQASSSTVFPKPCAHRSAELPGAACKAQYHLVMPEGTGTAGPKDE